MMIDFSFGPHEHRGANAACNKGSVLSSQANSELCPRDHRGANAARNNGCNLGCMSLPFAHPGNPEAGRLSCHGAIDTTAARAGGGLHGKGVGKLAVLGAPARMPGEKFNDLAAIL
eukprot:1159778-Pelagomonas_calceolata.AAC.3